MNLGLSLCMVVACCCWPGPPEQLFGVISRYISIEDNMPAAADSCYEEPKCEASSKYRTADGSCNNLAHPTWASALTPYLRLLPAHYYDGVHEPRRARNGYYLPNVRLLSRELFPDIYVPDSFYSLALMQWGQVVTHDSAATDFPVDQDCCPGGQFPVPPTALAGCKPIRVPHGDLYYSRFNVTCLFYTRAETTDSKLNCPVRPQQQISMATHWLDLSLMYGSNAEATNSIRSLHGGTIRMETVHGELTLPVTHEPQKFCWINSSNQSCLNTGDERVNQNPDLSVMTIVLTREHNRLADQLARLNPKWDDEKLFQEARRINIAQAQHITYAEYLRHILDEPHMVGMRLDSLQSGFTEYDAETRGGTLSEFTASIFRTFHSTVQGDLRLYGVGVSRGCPLKSAQLGDHWWTSGDLVLKCFQQLATGLLLQPPRIYHNFFTVQETEQFVRGSRSHGDDMESVDLMRGRDQGIPSYNRLRELCGLPTFSFFSELEAFMKPQIVRRLSRLYSDVEDIDLFLGALLERPVAPGLTGPTAQCIMAQQFARWKFPDRFYYEHRNQTGSFTSGQLEAIRKVTFSSLMCRNTNIGKIQRRGFYQPSFENYVVSCDRIPYIDLSSWKE